MSEQPEEEHPEDQVHDSLDVTPQMALRRATRRMEKWEQEEDGPPSKCLLIFLWDDEDKYTTAFENAGLSTSQSISLIEVMKYRMLKTMEPEE